MCCFSRSVSSVAATKIFARGLPDGRQALAYAMNVALGEELAMILPLPVPAQPAEDAVSFINLEGEESTTRFASTPSCHACWNTRSAAQ